MLGKLYSNTKFQNFCFLDVVLSKVPRDDKTANSVLNYFNNL